MTIALIVGSLIVVICVIGMILSRKDEELKLLIYKINISENNIVDNLANKEDYINRIMNIIERELDMEIKNLSDFKKLKSDKSNNYEKDTILTDAFIEINKIISDNPKVEEVKSFKGLIKDVNDIDNKLVSLRTYYNKYTNEYNNAIRKFPLSLISKIKKYKLKSLYNGQIIME